MHVIPQHQTLVQSVNILIDPLRHLTCRANLSFLRGLLEITQYNHNNS